MTTVAHVAVELAGWGGTESSVMETQKSSKLHYSGFDSYVIVGADAFKDRLDALDATSIQVKHEIPKKNLWPVVRDRYLRMIPRTWNIYKSIKHADIVHVHSKGDLVYSVLAAKLRRKKVMYTCHGLIYKPAYTRPLKYRLYNRMVSWALRNCDAIHAVSYAAKQGLIDAFGGGNVNSLPIKVVYLGSSSRRVKRKLDADFSSFRMVICSRLHKEKRYLTTLQAMDYLVNTMNFDRAHLDIYGSGSQRTQNDLKKWIEQYRLEHNVTLHGWSDADVAIRDAHLVIVPSTHDDAFPLSKYEAWNKSKPMLCFSDAGGKECVIDGYNGILVDNESPLEMAIKIQKLIKDPKWGRELAANGYKTSSMVSFNRGIEELVRTYEEILND